MSAHRWFLIRIRDFTTGRVWFEVRESEEDFDALANSIFENHPRQTHEVSAVELTDDPDARTPWVAEQVS